ncbi:hypothetical protein FCM35_KLT15276 [Carex littledalei]|uniref:Uncharacterized protein n=1 Tax=Carex littledalei TaxID=544730 RepID=A0A833VCN1_9POAL|nr:hypothetical protein FCM35_KLT15276 [Carex littledalei]
MKQSGYSRTMKFVILMVVFVAVASRCEGVTSKFRRKLEATEDMPFDSDVFSVPDGYNAPQQSSILLQNRAQNRDICYPKL